MRATTHLSALVVLGLAVPLLLAPGPIAPARPALVPGTLVAGSLAPGAETLADGELARRFTFSGTPGLTYRIWAASEQFDTMLYLYGPDGALVMTDDDGWQGTNSLLTFSPATAGAYDVVVSSYSPGEMGTFRVLLVEGTRYAPAATPLGVGTVADRLDPTDPVGLESGRPSDYYALAPVPLGQMVTLTLRSAAFDSLLFVVDSDGRILQSDDNSAGGRDATVTFPWTPAPDQAFYAVVSSVEPLASGGYVLERTGPTLGMPTPTPTPAPVPVPTPPAPATGTILTLGQRLEATLVPTDPAGRRAGPVDHYQFDLTERMLVQLGASSRDFDTYLQVYDARGALMGEDDDSGRRTDSLWVGELAPGDYVAEVSSFDGVQTGAYAIELSPAELRDEPEEIRVGTEVDGRWTVLHPTDEAGHRVALYSFHVPRDMSLTALLRPEDDETFCLLELEQQDGRHAETSIRTDDGCVIATEVRTGADYLLRAIGSRDDDDTTFLLALTAQDPAIRWSSLELDTDVRGHINWSSPFTDWNAPGTGFTFQLARGQRVDITVRQTELDARVFVLDMSGRVLESSVDTRRLMEGRGFTFTAPEDAWYRLIVTGRQRWFDAFTLRVSTR